jgi:hypothetical protein
MTIRSNFNHFRFLSTVKNKKNNLDCTFYCTINYYYALVFTIIASVNKNKIKKP